MARKHDYFETSFEKFKKKTKKPKGHRTIGQMSLSNDEMQMADYDLVFHDPDLQALHDKGVLDELLHELKSGKEATVYLGRNPAGLVAIKMYRDPETRLFKNDVAYRQGRFIRQSRIRRAIDQGTRKGLQVRQAMWIGEEYAQMASLYQAGIAVPRPLGLAGSAIAMEFIGSEAGPAPRLADVRFSRDEALRALEHCIGVLAAMLAVGKVHGDFSAYNILWHKGRAVVIDFPQVVETVVNPEADQILEQDVISLCKSFERFGIFPDVDEVLDEVERRADLQFRAQRTRQLGMQ